MESANEEKCSNGEWRIWNKVIKVSVVMEDGE